MSGQHARPELNISAVEDLVVGFIEWFTSQTLLGGSSSDERLRTAAALRDACLRGELAEFAFEVPVPSPTLQDPKVQFRIKKQHFIELLRARSDGAALAFLRNEFTPFAIGAYPEAYAELTDCLACLVYDDSTEPPMPEWSVDCRVSLASFLYTSLKLESGVQPSKLQLVLSYLALHHRRVTRTWGSAVAANADLDALVAEQRTRLPAPRSSATLPTPQSIQDLRQAVDISQDEAVDALLHAGGDLHAAFVRELRRLTVDDAALQDAVLEFCSQRGLSAGALASAAVSQHVSQHASRTVSSSGSPVPAPPPLRSAAVSAKLSAVLDGRASPRNGGARALRHEPASNLAPRAVDGDGDVVMSAEGGGKPAWGAGGAMDVDGVDADVRRAADDRQSDSLAAAFVGRANGSAAPASPSAGVGSQLGYTSHAMKGCRPRDASTPDSSQPATPGGVRGAGPLKPPGASPGRRLPSEAQAAVSQRPCAVAGAHEALSESAAHWEWLGRVTAAATAGDVPLLETLLRERCALDALPTALRFNIKRLQFCGLVAGGDYAGAQALAQLTLGPLAQAHPHLLPCLKDTLTVLVGASEVAPLRQTLQADVACHLSTHFARAPSERGATSRLVAMLEAGLAAHAYWCGREQWHDPFADALGLAALMQGSPAPPMRTQTAPDTPAEAPEAPASLPDDQAGDESDMQADGDDGDEADDAAFEQNVLQLTEVLNLPVDLARELLQQSGGDVQAAVAALLPEDG